MASSEPPPADDPLPAERIELLLPIADEFSNRVVRLYRLLRRPLYGGEVSLARTRVLGYILENGPQRIQELTYAEQVSQPSMTAMVVALEREGWVERLSVPTDKRVTLISLTPAGRQVVLDQRARRARAFAERLATMPNSAVGDVEVILESLDRVIELLELDTT